MLEPRAADAQATANAITQAPDAFGYRNGNESVGIYDERRVRGFNLEAAGNYRINGYYFVRSSGTNSPLVDGITVGIGRSAFANDLPGPSGVVSYAMKSPLPTRANQATFNLNTYGRPQFELLYDATTADGGLGVIGVVTFNPDENDFQGGSGRGLLVGLAPKLRLGEATINLFGIEYRYARDGQFRITTSGSVLPPRLERRRFLGQDWAREEGQSRLAGMTFDHPLGEAWQIGAGAFFSQNHPESAFLQLFSNVDATGKARSVVVASPEQRFTAWSGEMRLGWQTRHGDVEHRLSANLRGRRSRGRLGGDQLVDLGTVSLLGEQAQTEKPVLGGRSSSRDAVDQVGIGLTYRVAVGERLKASAGILKTDYEKRFAREPDVEQETSESPWLYNGIAALELTPALSAYVSYTRGLEEAGVAPQTAANRNAVLPAILATQREAGLRYALTPKVALILAAFDTRKPYAALRRDINLYDLIGTVRHAGIEASLSGEVARGLTAVVGGYRMSRALSGIEVDSGRLGRRPVGVPATRLTASLNYRLPVEPDIALDGHFEYTSRQAAHASALAGHPGVNDLVLPARATLDLGARYRFRAGRTPIAVRAQMQNVLNEYSWQVTSAEALTYSEPRRFRLSLTVDY